MEELTARNFGLAIAYLIPGFVALCGVGTMSPAVHAWLVGSPEPSVGGFLYVTLRSAAAGMTISAVRWAIIDSLLHRTGLSRPVWDDSKLAEKLSAVEFLVENYYRYYQFYANTLVAMTFWYAAWRLSSASHTTPFGWVDFGVLFIGVVFLAGSRDTLRKYYERATLLLGNRESEADRDERRRTSARKREEQENNK